jgi:antitoxin ParD1/3/4
MIMSKLERITVTMPEEMAAKMRAAVDAGAYATTSEIVREALRDWSEDQARKAAALAEIRSEIAKGFEGPFFDADEVFADLKEYVATLVQEQGKADAA